jgi:hypothetical protein
MYSCIYICTYFFQEFMGLFGQHAVVDEARWGDLTKTKQDMSPQGLANCFWAISKLAGTPEGMLGRLIQREIHFLGKLLGIIIIYVYIYKLYKYFGFLTQIQDYCNNPYETPQKWMRSDRFSGLLICWSSGGVIYLEDNNPMIRHWTQLRM